MKWFKHFSNASDSTKLNKLIDDLGIEAYGRYWLLLELLASEMYDGTEEVEIHFRKISGKVQIKFKKKLETFLEKLASYNLIEFKTHEKVYKIKCPILQELQDKDSKYNRKRVASSDNATTYKNKKKNNNKEEDYIYIQTLIKHWNFSNLLKVIETPPVMAMIQKGIAKELNKSRGINQIKKAISNYAQVFFSDETYYSHSFSIQDFIGNEKTDKFYEENFKYKNFLKNQERKTPRSKYAD